MENDKLSCHPSCLWLIVHKPVSMRGTYTHYCACDTNYKAIRFVCCRSSGQRVNNPYFVQIVHECRSPAVHICHSVLFQISFAVRFSFLYSVSFYFFFDYMRHDFSSFFGGVGVGVGGSAFYPISLFPFVMLWDFICALVCLQEAKEMVGLLLCTDDNINIYVYLLFRLCVLLCLTGAYTVAA